MSPEPPAGNLRWLDTLRASEQGQALMLFACAFLLFASLTPHVVRRLNPVTGDEPFYLMTAISLLDDHDLNEQNNYDQRDYERFYPRLSAGAAFDGWPAFPDPLPPHPTHASRSGLYSKHGLGLAVLVAPAFALGGRAGVVLLLNGLAALLVANAWLLARRVAGHWVSLVAAVAVCLTLPVLPYAYLIFPELPAALLLLYAARRLLADDNRPWQITLFSLCLGLLPWLHNRFLPLAGAAFLLYLARHRHSLRRPRRALALLLPAGCSAILYLGFLTWLYGAPRIPVEDHAGFNTPLGVVNATAGLLLDAQWGLLVYAPLFALGIAGLGPLLRSRWRDALTLLALAVPYLLLVASYRVWWGEWCPPARYLVPVAPLAVLPLAWLLTQAGRAGRLLFAGLLGWQAVLTVIGLADPQRLYHQPDGISHIYGRLGDLVGVNLNRFLVAFQPYAEAPLLARLTISCLVLAVLLALTALAFHLTRSPVDTGEDWDQRTLYVAPRS